MAVIRKDIAEDHQNTTNLVNSQCAAIVIVSAKPKYAVSAWKV